MTQPKKKQPRQTRFKTPKNLKSTQDATKQDKPLESNAVNAQGDMVNMVHKKVLISMKTSFFNRFMVSLLKKYQKLVHLFK